MANELKRTSQQQLPRQQAILLREEISQNGASGHLCFHFPNRGLISEVECAYCSEMSSRLLLKLLPTPCAFPRGRWTILKNKSIHTQKATHTRQWVCILLCFFVSLWPQSKWWVKVAGRTGIICAGVSVSPLPKLSLCPQGLLNRRSKSYRRANGSGW